VTLKDLWAKVRPILVAFGAGVVAVLSVIGGVALARWRDRKPADDAGAGDGPEDAQAVQPDASGAKYNAIEEASRAQIVAAGPDGALDRLDPVTRAAIDAVKRSAIDRALGG